MTTARILITEHFDSLVKRQWILEIFQSGSKSYPHAPEEKSEKPSLENVCKRAETFKKYVAGDCMKHPSIKLLPKPVVEEQI